MTFRPPLLGLHLGHGKPGAGPTTKHLSDAMRAAAALQQKATGVVKATPKKRTPAKD